MARVKLAEFIPGRKLTAIQKNTKDPRSLAAKVGALIAARSQKAFRDQKLGSGKQWAPRAVPNVPGIVTDVNAGANPKGRRFQTRPALRDTGQLQRSITFKVVNSNTVEVGSKLKYAGIHNTGGVSQVTISKSGIKKLSKWLKSKAADRLTDKERLVIVGSVFGRGPTFSWKVTKRTYLKVTGEDRKDIKAIIGRNITGRNP